MQFVPRRLPQFALLLSFAITSCVMAQDTPTKRGRKYRPPPATSHIEVTVMKKYNGKPISNAAVIFDSTLDGKSEGSLEVKTDPEGKAVIDVIPTGSSVRVQVIANGFATFADDYLSPSQPGDLHLDDSSAGAALVLSGQRGQSLLKETWSPGADPPSGTCCKPAAPPPTPQTTPQPPPNASDTTPKQ